MNSGDQKEEEKNRFKEKNNINVEQNVMIKTSFLHIRKQVF